MATLTNPHLEYIDALEAAFNKLQPLLAADPTPAQRQEYEDARTEVGRKVVSYREAADRLSQSRQRVVTLQPLTAIYGQKPNAVAILPSTRDYKLEDFKGDSIKCAADPYLCLDWIERALDIAESSNLTHPTALRLLRRHATREAGRVLGDAVDAQSTLRDAVLELEVNFAGLKLPLQARELCKTMTIKDKESINSFGRRVKLNAIMACRDIEDANERLSATELLAKDTFLASLPARIRIEIRTRLDERSRNGEAYPSYKPLVMEARRISDELEANYEVSRVRKQRQAEHIRFTEMTTPSSDETSYSSTDVEDYEDVMRIDQARRKPFSKKKPRDRKPRPTGRVHLAQDDDDCYYEMSPDGEYILLTRYVAERQTVRERIPLTTLNVQPDECAKCGLPGHRAFGEDGKKCPLRSKRLEMKACSACHKGGHLAADCPRKLDLLKN